MTLTENRFEEAGEAVETSRKAVAVDQGRAAGSSVPALASSIGRHGQI